MKPGDVDVCFSGEFLYSVRCKVLVCVFCWI